jgi:vacuolar protein sorting-associated protein 13D
LIAYNIGEYIEPNGVPPPYVRHRRSLSQKLSHDSSSSTHCKVELTVELDLVNVTLEVLKESVGSKLSRIDFIKSVFTFQNNSDGTKDVDLASQEILICDTRFDDDDNVEVEGKKNIFKNILQQSISPKPMPMPGSSSSSQPNSFHSSVPLQAEIHFRQSGRGSNLTIVMNNMRLMLILDWWMEVREFLTQKILDERQKLEEEVGGGRNVHRLRNASPLLERSRELSSPVTVSAGIVTKRAPVLDVPESTFELKINISNCELVVVEKASVWDTNAIILKSTAVLGYRPHLERPISCSLVQCELFSCILGLESETALSILDPADIQFELVRQAKSEPQGISDATFSLSNSGKVLKIQSPNLSLRLSYHDMKMFTRMMDKFSKEAQGHFMKSDEHELTTIYDNIRMGSLGNESVRGNCFNCCIEV